MSNIVCTNIENIKMCLTIDENTIYEFYEKINEESMIRSAKHIEKLLHENNAQPEKIQNVFELMIEVMQNMLNYSYGNVELENNKREANGILILSYNTIDDTYILQSCNLITQNEEEIIKSKVEQIKGLDDKELRKLAREKMRSKVHNHEKGAGLGYIMMARKCTEPISIDFLPFKNDILQYKLKLVI